MQVNPVCNYEAIGKDYECKMKCNLRQVQFLQVACPLAQILYLLSSQRGNVY